MKKLLLTTLALAIAFTANIGQSFAKCGCGCAIQPAAPCPEFVWAMPAKASCPCGISTIVPLPQACCPSACATPCCPKPCVTGCAAPCPCECAPKCCDADKYCNVNGCCKKKSWFYRIFHKSCCGCNSGCGCNNCCPTKTECCD